MANVQTYFETFDSKIRLGRFKENQTLREKRNIIRNKINDDLAAIFEKYEEEVPKPEWRDQGSYELGTGIKPIDGAEIDIDQGLYFDIDPQKWDPVTLKKRVREVLDGHTTKPPSIRRPCVTVWYQKDGEPIYHVDIAVYAKGSTWAKSQIAMGKENSSDEYCFWAVSDPQGLIDALYRQFPSGPRRDQFRRVVRALKRWKDLNFSDAGNEAPLGVALTACAYHGLQTEFADPFGLKDPDDRTALLNLVNWILSRIYPVWDPANQRNTRSIQVELPVEPFNDLFERMSNLHTERFETKLKKLRDALIDAGEEVKPEKACEILARVFGDDFPIPDPQDTARTTRKAFSRSGSSA